MTRPSLIRARPWAGPSRSGKWYRAERRRRRGRNAPRERSRRSRWWRSVSAEAGPIRPRDGSSLADSSPRRASRQLPPAGSIESPPSGISQPSQSKAATSRASTGASKSGKYKVREWLLARRYASRALTACPDAGHSWAISNTRSAVAVHPQCQLSGSAGVICLAVTSTHQNRPAVQRVRQRCAGEPLVQRIVDQDARQKDPLR